ncbi:MAG: glycosyltransferase family 2 protein [Armatimonadota bacterium]
MQEPLVSAVIPAYNEAEIIGRAIESVRKQTYSNIEIVVVDDGSSDDTAEVVRREHPDAVLVQQANKGLSGARNSGVRASSGEYLAFLDADDLWAPTKIERQLGALLGNPEFDWVGTNAVVEIGSRSYPHGPPWRPRLFELSLPEVLGYPGEMRPVGSSIMFSTEVFWDVGGYDEELAFAEDMDLFCRLLAAGHRLLYLNEPLYIIHKHPGSHSSRSVAVRGRARLQQISKLDPRRYRQTEAPLSPSQYGRAIAEEATKAAVACLRQEMIHEAHRYLQWLDETPDVPPVYRLQRWLAKRSPGLFGLSATVYHNWLLRPWRAFRKWGGLGGIARSFGKALCRTRIDWTQEVEG